MKENSIEEAIERLEKGINDIWFSTTYSQEQEKKDLKILLLNYKKALKENGTYKKQYFGLIDKIENKIANFDYEYKKAERKNNQERANYYWDLTRNFIKILEGEE